ncbi:MAG TPA: glycosyltransferase family 39 protein [bacterium]|nr:glycosyltransferase family 39 protein [bacterium]
MASLTGKIFSRNYPWPFFTVFFVANTLLSYVPLDYSLKGWIFVLGLLLPFILVIQGPVNAGETSLTEKADAFAVPKPLWVIAILAGIYLRFFKLTTFHLWPTGDESLHGFLAIPLAREWNWQFFYTVGEHPPLLIWILSWFYRFFESSFFNLWFFPAVFSCLAVPVGYLAARCFFPKPVSQIFALFLFLSFWPLYFGRFCHQGIFLPFWELSCLWVLGIYWSVSNPRSKSFLIFLLGIWTGLGSLTFTSWAVVLLLICMTVLIDCWRREKPRVFDFFSYSLGLLSGLLPFLWAAIREGYGHHLLDSSAASHWFTGEHEVLTYLDYVTCLFWGNFKADTSYGPSWGGMLNPILGSFFFLGLGELIRHWREAMAKWLISGFLIALSPAFFAADYVELNRVIQVLPFLLFIGVLGFYRLAGNLDGLKKAGLVLLLLASLALDLNHLLKPHLRGSALDAEWIKDSPDENFRAYEVLKKTSDQEGPGLIYTDFLLLSHGHSLNVTTYPFNAALNPKFDDQKAHWAAVVVNVHYQPKLSERFPGSKWAGVSSAPSEEGGMAVGIIPITPENREQLARWTKVHRYFHGLGLQAENILNNKIKYRSALSRLPEGYPLVKGDPFLESCFGEWLAQYHYAADYHQNIQALERAVAKGYPNAYLYFKLGNFLFADRDWEGARKAYAMAVRSKPNYTGAGDMLNLMEKGGTPKP